MKLRLKGYYSRVTVSGIGVFEADTMYEFDEETAKKLLETGAWEVVSLPTTTSSVQTSITISEGTQLSVTTSEGSVTVTTEGGEEE